MARTPATPQRVVIFADLRGREPLTRWLDTLNDATAYVTVMNRIHRLEAGNFGDAASVGDGVHELRVNYGPGFRVYFGRDGPSWCCCFAVERRAPRRGISQGRNDTGKVISKRKGGEHGTNNGIQFE